MTDLSFTFTPRPPGVPLSLWGSLMRAMQEAAEEEGYDLYFKESDGLGRVWVRPKAAREES